MKVGWLVSVPAYVGGAELTQAEFRAAAPEGVEIVNCPAGEVVPDLDRYVVHNCVPYSSSDIRAMGDSPRVKFVHDMWPEGDPEVREILIHKGTLIYCSPLHREHFERRWHPTAKAEVLPPALDLERLRQIGQGEGLMGEERKGAVWLGMNSALPSKGLDLAQDWAGGNGGLDIYGNNAPNGSVPYEDVPRLLAKYRTFVHLPRAIEPFGRSVVEAWAVGCELVINKLIGARYWIEENPRGLETASKRFWEVVGG